MIARKTRRFATTCASVLALSASLSANAAFVISGGASQPLPIYKNDFNSDLSGLGISEMITGAQLSVDADGYVDFYYIAAESLWKNRLVTATDSMSENDDGFNIAGYDMISIKVSAGDVLDFTFGSSMGKAVTVDNAAGTGLDNMGIFLSRTFPRILQPKVLSEAAAPDMLTSLILGYNDNDLARGDADYDDMMVRAEFRTSAVPVPAAVWLFGSGLLGLIGVARRKS